MKKNFFARGLVGLVLLFLNIHAWGQDFDHYKQVRSSGDLPRDFTKLTQQKVKEDINTLSDKSRGARKSKEQYMLEANYLIDELISSGKVLVNDPLGDYVNKVADKLLAHDPDLRSNIQLYVVKSPVVNAFTFDKGIIFVNIGLLAQLENEAQLAFILAHEITHFTSRHAINAYVEYDKIDQGRSSYRRSSYEDRITAKSNYSKELETEADIEGLELYMKSNYSIKEVPGAFDVLQYSYLPFEEIEFEKGFLETSNLVMPDDYFLAETAPIKADDNYDDSKSTHPNIRKRRTSVLKKIDEIDEGDRSKFLVSEEEFKKVREISRFEICRLYLIHRDYAEALYSAYILLKKYPGNLYLEKIVAKSLFGMAAYKNKGKMKYQKSYSFNEVEADLDDYDGTTRFRLPKFEDIEGNSQQVYHMLHKLNRDEMTVVALQYAWNVKKKAPNDAILNAITDSLFAQLVFANNLHPLDFSKKSREEIAKQNAEKEKEKEEEESEEQSKYDKIKSTQNKAEVESNQNFIKYAFVDLFTDREFTERFNYYSDKADSYKKSSRMAEGLSDRELRELERKQEKEQKALRKKGLSLGIDKIVIVDPYYNKIDTRKRNSVKYFAAETSQQTFTRRLKIAADKVGLAYDVIDPNTFRTTDVEKFNDFSVINDWVVERFNHEDKAHPVVMNTDEVDNLVEKYGTKYFLWTGVVNVREKKEDAFTTFLITLVLYPALPYGIYQLVTPEYETLYYSILFDVETGEVKMFDVNTVEQKDTGDLLNSYIYDTLLQIKKEDKGKKKAFARND